ncbi:MAG TPA: cytochrome o ubiquinol oxidase subunit III [Caulobacteraceae bacterium]|jgi:cytochrome o ubiquinol oxidase subunit 3
MSTVDTPLPFDPYQVGRARVDNPARGHGAGGPAAKRVIVAYGFWVFLLSDIIMFSAFFATYAVLAGATNGGPGAREVFDVRNVGVETVFLLLSSFSCGMASLAAGARNKPAFYASMAVTFLFGAAFLTLEMREFVGLIQASNGPSRSAFLSSFFALVGCHGAHVTAGLVWLLVMIAQVFAKGFRPEILRRTLCFSLFWHTLDIIWVALFTVVYLLGVLP